MITVDVVNNTQLLVITVDNPNPSLATEIANGIATIFSDRISQLQSQRFAVSIDVLAKQVSDMEGQIKDINDEIANTQDPSTLQQLQDRLTQYRTIDSNLVTSLEQVRLSEEQTNTNVIVSAPARANIIPIKPKTGLNTVLSVLAGMLLAAGIILVAEKLDDTVKNPEEIRRRFGLPILGIIMWHETLEGKPSRWQSRGR